MENKDSLFTYEDEKHNSKTISVCPGDFKFIQRDTKISDEIIKSKPTTFFKDAIRRFAKNKSSVVAAFILGFLVLLSLVLPAAIPYNITTQKNNEMYLEPKLFDAGTGWWDGTKKFTQITYDTVNEIPVGSPSGVEGDSYNKNAISNLKISKEGDYFFNGSGDGMKYAYGGQVRFNPDKTGKASSGEYTSYYYKYNLTVAQYDIKLDISEIPSDDLYTQGNYGVFFKYYPYNSTSSAYETEATYVTLQDYSTNTGTFNIDLNAKLTAAGAPTEYKVGNSASICFKVNKSTTDKDASILIKDMIISSTRNSDKEALSNVSINDGKTTISKVKQNTDGTANEYYWTSTSGKAAVYKANIIYADFTYDTYESAYGESDGFTLSESEVAGYISKGYMKLDLDTYKSKSSPTEQDLKNLQDSLVILDDSRCPVREVQSIKEISVPGLDPIINLNCKVSLYRYYGYTSMPRFLMGTDKSGNDLIKKAFSGLRNSLLLGVITSAICFIFGLVWGAITGYFGGWTDIIMERFTDIISGMPWIVVMTLVIVKFGSSFLSFGLALCLTGWIGTSAITRTQFYRYKRSEYILAARTLGASDTRLIFRHILPNAIGTIITSSVLMIPSVIFSEATISYLGLGLSGQASLGVILSENQAELQSHPYLIIFPSIIMALIMISFNLFGNGLRDAFNPSLKGED